MSGRRARLLRVARILAKGTAVIARAAWSKLWALGQADDDFVGPIVVVVVGVGMIYVLLIGAPILASPLTLAWLIGSYIAGTRATAAEEDTPEDEADELPVHARRAYGPPSDADFVTGLAQLIGRRNGVLLRAVADAFHEAGVTTDWDVPELRAQCDALGIPIKESIKVAGATSSGIHRDGLREALTTTVTARLEAAPTAPSQAPTETTSKKTWLRKVVPF
ncbi:hypothetical protein [Streptomyces sp. NPDC056242]|uniref:hypothetical protein n=1 Tax=Streptomyces sp. NPDC056242 TaxID=3345760 RepID=UPI0035E240B5